MIKQSLENETMNTSRWPALTVIAIIQLVLLLDATIVNVALPEIKYSLGFTDASLTWVVNAYLVAAGTLLLLGGRIGDAFGLRRIFQLGILIFAVFSSLAALAINVPMLIIGRIGQGVGEALASATGLAMVSLMFQSGTERDKAFAIWSALGGIGAIFGVLLSGLLTEYLSWRWVFGINVPIIAVLAIATALLIPKFPNKKHTKLDITNALIFVISISAIVLGIIGSAIEQLFTLRATLLLFGILGITIMLRRCKRSEDSIIPTGLIKRSPRLIGYIIVAILAGTSGALFYLGVLLLQDFLGMTPLQAGLAWLPFCTSFFGGIFLFQFISQKWGMRSAALAGLLISAIGYLLFAIGVSQYNYWIGVIPAMFITSIGFGCVAPVAQSLSTIGLTETDAGAGAGITTTIQQLFQVVGITLLVAIAVAVTSGSTTATIGIDGFIVTFVLAAITMIGGAVLIATKCSALLSADKVISFPIVE